MQKRRQKWAELKGAKQGSKDGGVGKPGAKVDLNKLRQQEAAALAVFQSGGGGNDKVCHVIFTSEKYYFA